MAAVDVYKSATADLIEGGTGGQIDLRTKLPFDFCAWLARRRQHAEVSYGDLTSKTDYGGSAMLSPIAGSTGIGEIGMLVDLATQPPDLAIELLPHRTLFPPAAAGRNRGRVHPRRLRLWRRGIQARPDGIYARAAMGAERRSDASPASTSSRRTRTTTSRTSRCRRRRIWSSTATNSEFDRQRRPAVDKRDVPARCDHLPADRRHRSTAAAAPRARKSNSMTRDISFEFELATRGRDRWQDQRRLSERASRQSRISIALRYSATCPFPRPSPSI